MACMEHRCQICKWCTFNNSPSMGFCPECGGDIISSYDDDDDEGDE